MRILRFAFRAPCPTAVRGVVAVGLLCVGCLDQVPSGEPTAPEILEIVLDAHRWTEPRLAGVVHEPCDPGCSPETILCQPSCPGKMEEVYHNLPVLVSEWMKDAGRSPDESHAVAVLALIGDEDLDTTERAVEMLETLADQPSPDARVLSDLAAGYVVLAQRAQRPELLPRAMRRADDAIRADPARVEARFNRALASSHLTLWPDAVAAWEAHSEHERDAGWVGEGAERLSEATLNRATWDATEGWERARDAVTGAADRSPALRELVEHHSTAARYWVERELLPAWARAWSGGGEAEAERSLGLARGIAEELAVAAGDTFLLDVVETIDAAEGRRLQLLADGHLAYGEAFRQYLNYEVSDSAAGFERARQTLAEGASPFRIRAEVDLATCRYQDHELPAALELLTPLRVEAARLRYRSLAGRVSWMIALVQTFGNLPTEAVGSYRSALAWFEAAGEPENVASVRARLAEMHSGVLDVDSEKAWRYRLPALAALPHVTDPRSRIYIVTEAANSFKEEMPPVTHLLREEVLKIAQRYEEHPVYHAVALRYFAESRLGTGERDEILADLTAAFERSGQVPHAAVRKALQARIRELEARLYRSDAPRRAVQAYGEALALLPEDEYRVYRAKLHLERATLLHAEDDAAAAAELAASAAEIEAEWQRVLDHRQPGEHEELWSRYFGWRRETFDAMVRLLADMDRPEDAFSYSEKARARELLDLIDDASKSKPVADGPLSPLTAEEIRRRLPEGTVLVEYALLGDRLLTWIVRRDARAEMSTTPLERDEIEDTVAGIYRAAEGRDPYLDPEALHRLHALLVAPVLTAAGPGDKLVFVPDGAVHGVPFAALRASSADRYLIQDHPIAVAPSATLHVYAEQRGREMPRGGAPRLLLIGDPAFDPDAHPDLERLSGAALETEDVAELYDGETVLEGERATKDAFLALWGRYDVVHFAGHAVANPVAPFKSMLVLAPSGSGPAAGTLYATELFTTRPPRTRLVILSACSSAGGHPIGALGVAGLVRPLLGAGVPAVVGSLWDVSDLATRELLTEFHQQLRAGADAATALQRAQCALLEGDNSALGTPFIWAPFEVVGSASLTGPRGQKED